MEHKPIQPEIPPHHEVRAPSFPSFARSIIPQAESKYRFSICTLVSNPQEYAEMTESFVRAGFSQDFCEFLYCDNSRSNQLDAYGAYNMFLSSAVGEYIILCHQDILLAYDRIEKLESCLTELNDKAPDWSLLGNAGGVDLGQNAMCVTHEDGFHHNSGVFPIKVHSLDENFILVRRSANLCVSHDLKGFHFYGTDLCQIARFVGRTAWVVDFHLLHKSTGKVDASFHEGYIAICKKYRAPLTAGYIQTTCIVIPVGRSRWKMNRAMFIRLRSLKKKSSLSPGDAEEKTRLTNSLGIGNYLLQLVLYKTVSPFYNLARSFRRRRAMFLRLKILERYGGDTPGWQVERDALAKALGPGNFAFQLVLYKLAAPWFNLSRSLQKRVSSRPTHPRR